MSIYRDKPTGRWRFDFDRWIGGARVRRRQLLPAGWTRSEADAFDRKESAALYAIAQGIARPRHTIGQAVALYVKGRVPELKAGKNAEREIECLEDWYLGRGLDELPEVCAEYAEDQAGALKPATIKNRIAYLRAACRWAWKRHSLGDQDPGARWLRELIADGHIAAGDVDERSILDVTPNDLRGYTQCHFFAGIGGWSLALRLAGWDDARPVWTGSCPCQPFSAAGAGKGFADERHLWPAWHYLIEQCRPPVLFGEQVEAAIRYGWLDLVRDDLEGSGYAFAAAGLPAACVGAPHIRQRLWFVADAGGQRQQFDAQRIGDAFGRLEASRRHDAGGCGRPAAVGQDDGSSQGLERRDARALGVERATAERGGADGAMGDAERDGLRVGGRPAADQPDESGDGPLLALGNTDSQREGALGGIPGRQAAERARSPWAAAEWLACRDGKARPVEPGVFPLAHGIPDRVGLLRGAGNAIVPQAAAAFIEAFEGVMP